MAKDFFEVKAHIVTPADERFTAIWQPERSVNRTRTKRCLLHRPLAEHVVNRISGQPAIVTSYNDKRELIIRAAAVFAFGVADQWQNASV
ncbi:hypothetical protein ACLB1T_29285 [Escherichia coli]